jgi:hypothetical protein
MTERPPEEARTNGPESGADAYRVDVGTFQGPLDLLLHLVRINEVDITDIPIVEITEQYDQYLTVMRELNLELAGEYVVMAATLMHIKSQMLLPPDPDASDEEQADPRAELAQQLLEYQRFRQAAENLQAMESRRSLIWTRPEIPGEFEGEELLAVRGGQDHLADRLAAAAAIGRLDGAAGGAAFAPGSDRRVPGCSGNDASASHPGFSTQALRRDSLGLEGRARDAGLRREWR